MTATADSISLDTSASADDAMSCRVCHEKLFVLTGPENRAPVVTMSARGQILSFAGSMACLACGTLV